MKTARISIPRSEFANLAMLPSLVRRNTGDSVLRWFVAEAAPERVVIELTTVSTALPAFEPIAEKGSRHAAVINVIPTGIGCSVGGFAGDAGPVTRLLAASCDLLITNPNAVNASDLIALPENLIYAEGSTIDLFCEQRASLHVPFGNRIGLIVEKAERWKIDHVLNIANAVHAVHGVDIVDVVVTTSPIGPRAVRMESGSYSGTIDDTDELFAACETLVARDASAIALATTIRDVRAADYRAHLRGRHPNPVGGAEAVVSHLVSRRFGIPAAHAPLINFLESDAEQTVVDPRSAGEAISRSGLASVLIGLQRAPQFAKRPTRVREVVSFDDVLAVVAPASALGGAPVISAHSSGVPIVAVREATVLDVTAAKLGLAGVMEVENYVEAAGVLLALQKGLSIQSLRRPLIPLEPRTVAGESKEAARASSDGSEDKRSLSRGA